MPLSRALADRDPASFPPGLPDKQPAAHKHDPTPHQKAQVPGKLVGTWPHVVDLEEMVINDALDQVEEPPSNQKRSNKDPGRPKDVNTANCSPEYNQAHHGEDVRCGME